MTDLLNAAGFGSGRGAQLAGRLGKSLNKELTKN